MCEVISPVRKQFVGDKIRYSVDWSVTLKPELPNYPPVTRDRIETVNWSIASDSPASGVLLLDAGFDSDIGVAWVSVESDGSLVADDVVYINCTITTAGIKAFGNLTSDTSGQRITKQIRIRFDEC